jgi:hypothetical protein
MKKHFRMVEDFTSYVASTPVEIDSEWFPDFKGTTDKEFFDYIIENYENFLEDESLPEEVLDALNELMYGDKEEYYNSSYKFFSGGIEMGNPSTEHHKNGNFETEFTNQE